MEVPRLGVESRATAAGLHHSLITPFTTTQKACAGVDIWLSEASSATIEGDVMKIANSGGDVVGGLEKEDR